jgi:hypothetical protein
MSSHCHNRIGWIDRESHRDVEIENIQIEQDTWIGYLDPTMDLTSMW